jgi:uncharacterized protein YycO
MKMRLAFRHDTGSHIRYWIARFSGAPVHVAVLFDATCIEADPGGVTKSEWGHRTGEWTIVDVPASPIDVQAAYRWAALQVGRKYDWKGVLWAWWFGRAAGSGARTKWFCSELAAEALKVARIDLHRKRAAYFTPRRLWDVVAPWR